MDATQFFHEYAGYSYDPRTETPEQGRMRCSQMLADAETLYLEAHRVAGVTIMWKDDPNGSYHYEQDKAAGYLPPGTKKPKSIELAYLDHNSTSLASLGGIWDADANYRRVVRTELALECSDELRRIITKS